MGETKANLRTCRQAGWPKGFEKHDEKIAKAYGGATTAKWVALAAGPKSLSLAVMCTITALTSTNQHLLHGIKAGVVRMWN